MRLEVFVVLHVLELHVLELVVLQLHVLELHVLESLESQQIQAIHVGFQTRQQ